MFQYSTAVLLLTVLIMNSSCKENTLIRTDVVPAVDNITVFGTDTLTLWTKSVKEDSIATNAYVSGLSVYMGAGNITSDPFFGRTDADFYFQVRQPSDNYTFDNTKYQVDSAVIILPYSGFAYGDTTTSAGFQTFEAYRMTEQIYFDTIYYANSAPRRVEGTPMATATVHLPSLIRSYYDSTLVGGVKRAPHVRMRLNDALVNDLIGNSGTDRYANTANFLAYFNGIYIKATQASNTIPYFLLNGDDNFSKAGILVYYHTRNSSGAITDTLAVSYPFDATASQTKTAFFNRVSRSYAGTPAEALFNSRAITDNTVLIQNLPGAAMDIRIPYAQNLPLCIVNKAELVITQIAAPMDAIYEMPPRIYPQVVDESGRKGPIADREPVTSLVPLTFIDGNLRSANLGGVIVNQYVVNFPRELQNAIAGRKKELRLRINGTQSFIGAYRGTVAGKTFSQPAYQMKLNVVYTKL